ncbi:protein IQ-DOMAIN 12 isoform X3 [Manihot esculenta]|uniref:DUF4005 domain-containing protein n=3 Tax=Manihot esculenta TaxID=3983 RepID=A0A199UCM2_MANES|nr:protein IQ-DOMAIN 12 isoform X3 [Manihot esculenta]
MAKKTCWFGWFKRLFVSQEKTRTEKKSRRWRWILGKLKLKQRPVLPSPQWIIDEAAEKQRKFAVTVALATAAAAEAAVAAAQVAAEVVKLTGSSQSRLHFAMKDENLAAIKIQSAFRGYLARKALRALKGVVKLQAIVRGQVVRRQVGTKLKRLPSNTKMRSKVRVTTIDICKEGENKQLSKSKELGEMDSKLECKSQSCWDYSTLSKEDMESLWFKKQEASIKRDRMMKYSFSHRERRNTHVLEESIAKNEPDKQRHWLEELANKDALARVRIENLKASHIFGTTQVKMSSRKQDNIEALSSPVSFPRRSFCRSQRNITGDDSSALNSSVFPTYMAATESAKAKARSMSTPRQRIGIQDHFLIDSLSYKSGLSLWSSYNSEWFGNSSEAAQRVPISVNRHY